MSHQFSFPRKVNFGSIFQQHALTPGFLESEYYIKNKWRLTSEILIPVIDQDVAILGKVDDKTLEKIYRELLEHYSFTSKLDEIVKRFPNTAVAIAMYLNMVDIVEKYGHLFNDINDMQVFVFKPQYVEYIKQIPLTRRRVLIDEYNKRLRQSGLPGAIYFMEYYN